MKENLLVTLADRNYIEQAKQLFSGAYWNAGWKGDYMLLAHEISEKDLKWFRDKGILIRKCKPLYDKNISKVYPPVVLDKFYLFTEEFKKWKHVVFLDGDVLIRASLDGLTKINGFYACRDRIKFKEQFKKDKLLKELRKELKINLSDKSFNSGIIAFSTNIINEDSFEELKRLFDRYNSICIPGEQPILNIYFYKKWKELPLQYNVYMNYLTLCGIPPKNFSGINLHFAKRDKNTELWNEKNPYNSEWKKNLKKVKLINLNKIPYEKRLKLPQNYSFFVKFRYFLVSLLYLLKKISAEPNRIIGQIGIFLKKHNPNLYYSLKDKKPRNP